MFVYRCEFSYANASCIAVTVEKRLAMNTRAIITVAAVAALAAPAAAAAKPIPAKRPASQVSKQVAKRHVAPRVLCICVTIPAGALPTQSEVDLEAQADLDLIAHGLEPGYAYLQTTPELQAQYDAVLVAHGLSPYFNAARTAQAPSV
jgi:uncharacterized protein involved in high-affinity Fe2+ transport